MGVHLLPQSTKMLSLKLIPKTAGLTMLILLRDYQEQAIEKIRDSFEKGVTRQLVTLPTGSGKTVIMAALARSLGKRTLLLAHREELITQAEAKFKMVWPDVDSGICMAGQNDTGNFVVFGSVQSCSRDSRLQELRRNDFELLLIDEAHHANSPSYQKIIGEVFSAGHKKRLMVGVTATPMRSDNEELGDVFEEITYSISIGSMIRAGYLSPVVGRRILTKTSLQGIHTRAGDFAVGELSEAVNTPERNAFVVENYGKYAARRKGVAFCCDVQHCKDLAEAFLKADIPSKAVYGDMCPIERRNALQELKSGQIQVVTSCGVLTEGFDEPSISCVVMARPTKFKGLYIQCVGRGLRLHPSKSDCLVLDFADEGHNLETIASLGSTIPESEHVGERQEPIEKEKVAHSVNIRRVCDEEFDILGATRFIWIPIGDDEWSLADDTGNEIVMSPHNGGYIATAYWKDGREGHIVSSPLPIEYCSGCCEDFARYRFVLNYASTESPWLNCSLPPSDGQLAYLEKKGIATEGMTKAQASMKIREVIAKQKKQFRQMGREPATAKQAYFLKEAGVNPEGMTKLDAMKIIANIKKESNVVNA
jgi:ATP-dependent helicase IRC3